jgi:hypothetical protein
MVSGGDTRLAAPGQEQSLYGIDKLVGLNDLRFYVDDTGTTEAVHLDTTGLKLWMQNPSPNAGFRNTLTPKNIVKAWGIVKPSNNQILDGFNVESVSGGVLQGGGALITLAEGLAGDFCIVGNVHRQSPFFSNFVYLADRRQIEVRTWYFESTSNGYGALRQNDLGSETIIVSFVVFGSQ